MCRQKSQPPPPNMITRFSAPPSISKSAHFNMKRQSRPVSNGASAVSAGNVPNREGISNFEIPNASCENPADRPVPWMQSALSIANAELSRAMGLQENRVFIVSEEPLKQLPAKSAAPLVARALKNRPDLIALGDQVESARKFARAQRAGRLPKLEAFGSFGR